MSDEFMEGLNDLTPEEKVAKLIDAYKDANLRAEQAEIARKKQESDISRGINKLKDEKDYFLMMKENATKLMKDKNYFVELVQKDEVLAKAVLDEYFDWMTIEEAMAQVDADKQVHQPVSKKTIEETVKEITTKQEVENIINNFKNQSKLTPEQLEAFNKEFADITEWKRLTKDNVNKYLRLSFKEALPDVDLNIERDAIEMAWWTPSGASKPKNEVAQIRKANIEYLKKQWII